MLANMQQLESQFDELDAQFDDQLNDLLHPDMSELDDILKRAGMQPKSSTTEDNKSDD